MASTATRRPEWRALSPCSKRTVEEGVTDAEFYDAFAVALVVGGSIVIPHMRRAVARLEELPAT